MNRKRNKDFDIEDFKVARFDDTVHLQADYDGSHQPIPVVKNKEVTEIDLFTVMKNFVHIYEQVDISDEAMVKPNYSYTELIYLALLRSLNFCLPINEIYKYFQNKFVFYKNNTRLHWKNSIRDSLSKTKCFTKINKGSGIFSTSNRSCFLWSIDPCSIIYFARGDYRPSGVTNTLRLRYLQFNGSNFWNQVATVLKDKIECFKVTISDGSTPSKLFEQQTCELPNPSSIANLVHQSVTISSPPPVNDDSQPPIYSHQFTPPPIVVCQPNDDVYSSSTLTLYSSSNPIVYQPHEQDSSPVNDIEALRRAYTKFETGENLCDDW